MDDKLYRDVGHRLKLLREECFLTIDIAAEMIGISRNVLANIETGRKKVSLGELVKICSYYGVTVDYLASPADFKTLSENLGQTLVKAVSESTEKKRIETILYILVKAGSKPEIGEAFLHKMLFFIDLSSFERYKAPLVEFTYIKENYGPVPVGFDKIIEDMVNREELVRVDNKYFIKHKTKYLPLRKPNLEVFNAAETDIIDSVLNKLSDISLQELTEYCFSNNLISDTPEMKIIPYTWLSSKLKRKGYKKSSINQRKVTNSKIK